MLNLTIYVLSKTDFSFDVKEIFMSRATVKERKIFEGYCAYMEKTGFSYRKFENEEEFAISMYTVDKNDIPITLIIRIPYGAERIMYLAQMPGTMEKSKILDGAVATCMVNDVIAVGNFDYDVMKGNTFFRYGYCTYGGIMLDEEAFAGLTRIIVLTIELYNEKFLMLADGRLTLEEFFEQVRRKD